MRGKIPGRTLDLKVIIISIIIILRFSQRYLRRPKSVGCDTVSTGK